MFSIISLIILAVERLNLHYICTRSRVVMIHSEQ